MGLAASKPRLKVSVADAEVRGSAAVAVTALLGFKGEDSEGALQPQALNT